MIVKDYTFRDINSILQVMDLEYLNLKCILENHLNTFLKILFRKKLKFFVIILSIILVLPDSFLVNSCCSIRLNQKFFVILFE